MSWTRLTPEGLIVLTLEHGAHAYVELRRETGLSDRWLTRKLGELAREGKIARDGRWYRLSVGATIEPWERALYRRSHQLPPLVEGLAREFPSVRAVILFGSTADGSCGREGDVDLLIVTGDRECRARMGEYLIQAQLDLHIDLDPVILTVDDFLATVRTREGGLVFGLARGYVVLLDRSGGRLSDALRREVQEILSNRTYIPEAAQWVATG